MNEDQPLILVVDDNEMNRDMLSRRLARQGCRTVAAEDGLQALELVQTQRFDLILLDIMMPNLTGYEVLERLKQAPEQRHIPIIMISAVDDLDSVVKCVEMGADDYLFKPFNPILLRARINASLEKKRLREQEQKLKQAIGETRYNRLPALVAERARQGETPIAEHFAQVTALVAGISGITETHVPAPDVVRHLSDLFAEFDRLVEKHGLYRVKIFSHLYAAAGGPFTPQTDPAQAIPALADDMQALMTGIEAEHLSVQIGIHTGPALGGVIQTPERLYYDLWGDAVTGALEAQAQARPGTIYLSAPASA